VSASLPAASDVTVLHDALLRWYAVHSRPLPWRDPGCSPWGVLLSEVMSHQTPITRVEPIWRVWMERWPTPADLARESPGEVIRAWGRLGYPRRALRLHESAAAIVERHGGAVPRDQALLRALPGIGDYTAAAVAAFAFGDRSVVVDTNVRRVQARVVRGLAQAAPALTRAEVALAEALLPEDDDDARTWNVAAMELGALVCTARAPRCDACPVSRSCAWLLAGRPAYDGPVRRGQAWHGTDRQVRGAILQSLRERSAAVARPELAPTHSEAQVDRCLAGLIEDGLVEPAPGDRFALPGLAQASA
jgi:A/G-specific adenine glycosylase